jgi:hypothetical protein
MHQFMSSIIIAFVVRLELGRSMSISLNFQTGSIKDICEIISIIDVPISQ